MIQNLVAAIAARFGQNFDGAQILTSAVKTPPASLPAIVITPGKFSVQQVIKELAAESNLQIIEQTITKTSKLKTSTYPLSYAPVPNTLQAALLKTNLPPQALKEGADFTVDYDKSTLSFTSDKAAVSDQVLVSYTSIQITVERQFEQELFIDAYDASLAGAEKWASLACAIILSSIDELLKTFNQAAPYRQKLFTTTHELSRIQLIDGAPIPDDKFSAYRLKFSATGKLHLVRQIAEGPSVIKEVVIDQKFG